ncbi:MAG: DNA double-strand break repair nuclease NurA [Candidatus Bathyarchaeota archaeon]|nr:DNA double-strand break repair nuclease NurA [Candidatus Bathyarchaeota archaeon]
MPQCHGSVCLTGKLKSDLEKMEETLRDYVQKGCNLYFNNVKGEPLISQTPLISNFTALQTIETGNVRFFAVDCSTRTLKRANNWGIYVCRVSYAAVLKRKVDWGFQESLKAIKGDAYVRRKTLQKERLQLESKMAMRLAREASEDDIILLDGAGYFGGERKFNVMLYEECSKKGIRLLALSKQSPMLRDQKGRDLIASVCTLGTKGPWVYHPVKKANIHKHLYGDISIIKLCAESPRAFRCDIMSYLANSDIHAILEPLCSISEDPRCLGYPVALWLAHDFSSVSETKLLQYHMEVENVLENAGLLDSLKKEEIACNFADELHGAKYAFNLEQISHV